MKGSKLVVIGSLLAIATTQYTSAEIKIGVVTSATGSVSMVGIPQKNTVALLPKTIGGESVRYISLNDGSDPARTVTAINKLITEHNVDAIIGPSGSPNANAVIGITAKAGVPLLAPVGTSSIVLPMNEQKKWVFKTTQNDEIIAEALVQDMVKRKIKTLGFIGSSDPYGENWSKVVSVLAQKNGITVIQKESFKRQDTGLIEEIARVIAKKPDAVLIAAPGNAALTPQVALHDRGYTGQIYQTHGAALNQFLKMGGKKVENTILAASLMLVLDEIPNSHPSKSIALKYIAEYKRQNGSSPSTFGANVYDAGLLLERAIPIALKSNKPGTLQFRQALRAALEQTKELPATQGVYNMTPMDHSGFDKRGRELIVVKNGQWKLLK